MTRYGSIEDIVEEYKRHGFIVEFGEFDDGTEILTFTFPIVSDYAIYRDVVESIVELTGFKTYYFSVDDNGRAQVVFY